MPSFISNNGIWGPAKERAFDPKSGEIYDGPDREAVKYIEEEGGVVGQDAAQDPQVLQASRNMGFNSVKEYLDHFKPSDKQVAEKKAADSKIVTHAKPIPKEGVTGGTKGGFYDPEKEQPESVMAKKK